MLAKWNKTKARMTGTVGYQSEDGQFDLSRLWGGEPLVRCWLLYRVTPRVVPRHWVEPYEEFDEDLGEVVEQPGYWAGPYTEHDLTRLADWPDSPSGPTRRASEWIMTNKKDEVTA